MTFGWMPRPPSRARAPAVKCFQGRELGASRSSTEARALNMRRLCTLTREAVPSLSEAVTDCMAMDVSSVSVRLLHSVPPFLRRHQVPPPYSHPYPPSHALCFTCVLCLCAQPGAILLADVLFLSKIWQTRSEFHRGPRWSPFLLWMAWKPCPGRICWQTLLNYIQFALSSERRCSPSSLFFLPRFFLDFSFSESSLFFVSLVFSFSCRLSGGSH
jgi:hypothetical protein